MSLKPSEKLPLPAWPSLLPVGSFAPPSLSSNSFNPNKFSKSCVCVCVCFWYIRTDHVCASLREYYLATLWQDFLIYRIWEVLGDSEMSFKGSGTKTSIRYPLFGVAGITVLFFLWLFFLTTLIFPIRLITLDHPLIIAFSYILFLPHSTLIST